MKCNPISVFTQKKEKIKEKCFFRKNIYKLTTVKLGNRKRVHSEDTPIYFKAPKKRKKVNNSAALQKRSCFWSSRAGNLCLGWTGGWAGLGLGWNQFVTGLGLDYTWTRLFFSWFWNFIVEVFLIVKVVQLKFLFQKFLIFFIKFQFLKQFFFDFSRFEWLISFL